MLFSIDRIEGDRAVLIGEDGTPLVVPLSVLPAEARSTDMVRRENGVFLLATEESARRRAQVAGLLNTLLQPAKPSSGAKATPAEGGQPNALPTATRPTESEQPSASPSATPPATTPPATDEQPSAPPSAAPPAPTPPSSNKQ